MSETVRINITVDIGLAGQRQETLSVDTEEWQEMDDDEKHQLVYDYITENILTFGWEEE